MLRSRSPEWNRPYHTNNLQVLACSFKNVKGVVGNTQQAVVIETMHSQQVVLLQQSYEQRPPGRPLVRR